MATVRKTRAAGPPVAVDVPRPRRLPSQARGHTAFEAILSTSARLIEEGGIERLNTNLVAAESGVNISTVYKYFPNKLAIVATLFQTQSAERYATAFEYLDRLPQTADWPSLLDRAVDRLVALQRSQPGQVALRRAVRSSPDLIPLYAQSMHRAADRLAGVLHERTGLPGARSLVIARATIEMQVAMLDWWESDEGGRDPAIVRELKLMLRSYLSAHLGS